jgi:hypothetical protein
MSVSIGNSMSIDLNPENVTRANGAGVLSFLGSCDGRRR